MTLQNEIMNAVHEAVNDAARAAEDNWKQKPELSGTAMLTGRNADAFGDMAAVELTFETHPDRLPQASRDMYGVAGKTRAADVSRHRNRRVSPETLMRETQEVLEDTFGRSFSMRTGAFGGTKIPGGNAG